MNPKKMAADLLERGAEIIVERGWVQGMEVTPYGVCAYGALKFACDEKIGLDWATTECVYSEINNRAMEHFDRIGWRYLDPKIAVIHPLAQYNDHKAKSADEVIDVMKHIAKDIRNTLTPEEES